MIQNKAITVLFIAFLATACTRATPTEPGQTRQGEPVAITECAKVPPLVFPEKRPPFTTEVRMTAQNACTTPAKCMADNRETLALLAQVYCKANLNENCVRFGQNCPVGQGCQAKPVAEDLDNISLAKVSSAASPRCTKPGEQLCSADLLLAANKSFQCQCLCAN